ncbi:MAG: hypothetical protein JWP20_179 [Roseomonas sp.]|nr:hypothetical protein [Roseomonas sp.]
MEAGPLRSTGSSGPAAYGIGLALGLLAAAWLVGLGPLGGQGGLWAQPGVDLSQNLAGHMAFQSGGWRWPLLVSGNLFWPGGFSIAMTDSNPLLSLLAKAVVAPLAGGPVNLFGAWVALCWLVQPLAAIYALRGFAAKPAGGSNPDSAGSEDAAGPAAQPSARARYSACGPASLGRGRAIAMAATAGAMALLWPALLHRIGHINLLGHFCLLLALGLAARAVGRGAGLPFGRSLALLAVTILIHPYLFLFAGAVLAAPLLRRHPGGRRGWGKEAARFLALLVLPVLLYRLLSGGTGGADRGYGHYSMNLLSPVWPQVSGLFGAHLPVLDATGGQYEGFNYLGAGTLLLVALALLAGWWRGWRRWLPLLLALAGLAAVAVTPRVYAGPWLVVPLPAWPWDQIFGIVRASGRAFWPVGYALLLGAIAFLGSRLPGRWLAPVLGLAVLLQAADAAPLLRQARDRLALGEVGLPPLPPLPAGLALLRIAPACPGPGVDSSVAERMRLAAVRQGAALAEIRASRQPRWFNCETGLSDALETPLRPGEARLFFGPAIAALRPRALGEGVSCRRQGEVVFCARDLPLAGEPVPEGRPLPLLAPDLPPLLATGWALDAAGLAWSEGPRATLLFRTDARRLRLRLEGVGRWAGDAREAVLRVNDGAPLTVALPDLQTTDLLLDIPAGAAPVRVVIDLHRPADPAGRGLPAPVRRAGVRLLSVSAAEQQ